MGLGPDRPRLAAAGLAMVVCGVAWAQGPAGGQGPRPDRPAPPTKSRTIIRFDIGGDNAGGRPREAADKEVLSIKGHTGKITSVAYSPDGKRIVSGSADLTVKVWDAETGEELLTLRGHTGGVNGVAFSPDGKKILSGGGGRYDPQAGLALPSEVRLWDATTGKPLLALRGHENTVTSVAYSPDGKKILSGDFTGVIKVWDPSKRKEISTFKAHTSPIISVAYSPDGKRIVSTCWADGNEPKVWDLLKGRLVGTLKGHTARVEFARYSPDGKRILTGSWDDTMKLWDATTGKEVRTLKGHPGPVHTAAFSPDGKRIVSGSGANGIIKNTLKLWDTATGQEVRTVKGKTIDPVSVAFSPDGKRIVVASDFLDDHTLRIWDADRAKEVVAGQGQPPGEPQGHAMSVDGVAFSPDGKRILSAAGDNTLTVRAAATGEKVRTIKGEMNGYFNAGFSPDGKRTAIGVSGVKLKVWDVDTGEEVRTLPGHKLPAIGVALSPGGKRMASFSVLGKELKVWDVDAGREALTLKGHTGFVTVAAFSPDGLRILSADSAGGLKTWDAATGREVLGLKGEEDLESTVEITRDGTLKIRMGDAVDGSDDLKARDMDANKGPGGPRPKAASGRGPQGRAPAQPQRPALQKGVRAGAAPDEKPDEMVLLPTAEKGHPATWLYTTTEPPAGWNAPQFDTQGWIEGKAGFCSGKMPTIRRNTLWNTPAIWMRVSVEVPRLSPDHDYVLRVAHDDGLTVYLNGVQIYQRNGVSRSYGGYRDVVLDDSLAALIRKGKNTLAVKCIDTGGDCGVDVGLSLAPKQ